MDTILVTGYAQAPKGSSMYEAYKTTGIILEINPDNHTIIRAEYTFLTDLGKSYTSRLIAGYDLSRGIEPLVERIQSHCFTASTDSMVMALRIAYQRYVQTALPKLGKKLPRPEDQAKPQ